MDQHYLREFCHNNGIFQLEKRSEVVGLMGAKSLLRNALLGLHIVTKYQPIVFLYLNFYKSSNGWQLRIDLDLFLLGNLYH